MKRRGTLALVGLSCVALAACAVDRGACQASHMEHQDGYMTSDAMSFDGGKTTTFMPRWVPDSDWTVCDKWEFPNGRPKEAASHA